MAIPTIVGFTSSNRVPGFYGETVYGAGALSAASVPLVLLLTGLMTPTSSSTTATPNQDVVDILSAEDADAYFGVGYELSRMCYSALKVPGVKIKAAPVPEAGGATASAQVITISGSWTTVGTLTYRVNGEIIQQSIGSTDSIANVCTALAATFNEQPRRPYTAAATATQVILTLKSKSARGNRFITFQDTTKGPSGLVSRIAGSTWILSTAYTTTGPISFVVPVTANGFYYKCTTAGTTAGTEPTWPTSIGTTVTDGTAVWTCWGAILTGAATTWGGGAGTEAATTLLTVLLPQGFDRIVSSMNDATNLALWKTQLNNQAGPTSNLLQHFITGINGTLAAAATLTTVTMNAERMQLMWQLNGETAPWETSAYFGALRTSTEQQDPDAAYDDAHLLGTAPNSQASERPTNATLQSAINNGITAIMTDPLGSSARICRSVTTHTLTGATPDYRTLDTSDAYVPDFVRRDIGLFWSTVFKPANPRVADDPPADAKPLAAGVATPSNWNSNVEAKLRNYEKGILSSGSSPAKPTVAPIIILVDDNKPNSGYDPVAKRIMSAIPVVPAPNQHQIGVSVRNTSNA